MKTLIIIYNHITRGLREALPGIDIIRVQDTEIYKASDPVVLEWAAKEGRVLLTHDVQTMIGYAFERVKAGLTMLGVIEVSTSTSIGTAIEELAILIGAGKDKDFENQVKHVPIH